MTLLSIIYISSVQNFGPLGSVDAYNSYNGVGRELGRELGTFCVLSRVASQLKTRRQKDTNNLKPI